MKIFVNRVLDQLVILLDTHLVLIHLRVKVIEMQLYLGELDQQLTSFKMVQEMMFSTIVPYIT